MSITPSSSSTSSTTPSASGTVTSSMTATASFSRTASSSMTVTASPTSSLSIGTSPSITSSPSKSPSRSPTGLVVGTVTASQSVSNYGTTIPLATTTISDSPTLSTSQSPTQSSSYALGSGDNSGISASVMTSPSIFSDLLMNGGIAAGIGFIITGVVILIFVKRRRKRVLKPTLTLSIPSSPSSSFEIMNPLKQRQQIPQSPRSRPPKTAMKSYEDTVKDEATSAAIRPVVI